MKVSGFTFVRNATKLFYPVKQSIQSILPIVDEFIVALGNCDEDDATESEILSIRSEKIKIIRSEWDLKKYPNGMEYARQTDIAKQACTGDWLFYIQSDEVVHEKYLPVIKEQCRKLLDNKRVEGLLFNYRHFWGDFNHYVVSHAWYPREIRIIRNLKDIHSWRDAQSFRHIFNFDGIDYCRKKNTRTLNVIPIDAGIFHYGFVRPPRLMQKKAVNHRSNYDGNTLKVKNQSEKFNYGDLSKLNVYNDTHPEVMKEWISKFDWEEDLFPTVKTKSLHPQKHEKFKYKALTFLEQKLMGGRQLFGFKNYRVLPSLSDKDDGVGI